MAQSRRGRSARWLARTRITALFIEEVQSEFDGRSWRAPPGHATTRVEIELILIARGRDAADIPMIASFGPHNLTKFQVITEEISEDTALTA